MENVWRDIFNWKSILAFSLGILLNLSAGSFPENSISGSLLKEIGTALLVAVFVYAFFEVASRRQQEERIDSRIERISRNVFFGVFRRDLPDELINEVSLLILEANIIRKHFSITYTLTDDLYDSWDGIQTPFVRLRAVAQFTLKNIGTVDCPARIGVGLPNPIAPKLRESVDVFSIRITRDRREEDEIDIAKEREVMRKEMENDTATTVFCGKQIVISPGEEVRVYADYVMAKEPEDTEVLTSIYPTDGLRITVIDRSPQRRIIRARSIHRANIQDHSSPREMGTHIYAVERHMLPYQGMILWWKARPTQGAETLEPAGTGL